MKHLLILCPVLIMFAFATFTQAQVANNTALVGTVLDSSGSAVVGAKVTAVEESTGVVYPGTTNAQGYYSIKFIPPGTYDITVEQTSFSKLTKTGTIVPIDQAVRTDFSLKAGSETQTVTVSASTPPIQTDDATIGETFDTKAVQDLPLMGHNALEIAATASNVTIGPSSGYNNVPPGEDFIGAGQREIQSSMTLDGVSIMNNLITTAPARPSSDMISEVQMQTGNYPAQYGSYLGLHVNLVSKSGTNDLHGAVYDYIQNTALNAHDFFDQPGAPSRSTTTTNTDSTWAGRSIFRNSTMARTKHSSSLHGRNSTRCRSLRALHRRLRRRRGQEISPRSECRLPTRSPACFIPTIRFRLQS